MLDKASAVWYNNELKIKSGMHVFVRWESLPRRIPCVSLLVCKFACILSAEHGRMAPESED
ncbi:MAG: hypothetical protein IKC26_03815 [Clostridia bacterium]|nr:hypothetical protein [Clostridia bacterium]